MSFTIKVRAWCALALLGLSSCSGAESDEELEQEVVDQSDAGEVRARSTSQNLNISSCGQALLAHYKDTPFVPLVRWNTNSTAGAAAPRDLMTTDPRWYGCTGESRSDDYGFGDTYYFKGVVGLLYRPDQPPPPGTVSVYGYDSSVRGTGTGFPEPRRDHCISTNPLPPTITGNPTARYALGRIEGHALSWSYRPVSGDGTQAFYLLNKTSTTGTIYDCYNDTATTIPSGYTGTNVGLSGYVKTEASQTLTPTDECLTDQSCAATELCYWRESSPGVTSGTRGVCTPRCLTNAECGGNYPVCDIEARRCARALVSFRGPEATFTRSTVGTYQSGKSRIAQAGVDELRFDDRGDGFGPQALIEVAAVNRLASSNNATVATSWTATYGTAFTSTDSPGPHDGSIFRRTILNTPRLWPVASGTTGTAPHAVSFWSKAQVYTGTYTYNDFINVVGGTALTSTPSSDWTRIALFGSFDPTVSSNIQIQGNSAMPLTDGRSIAYAQIEAGTYPTTAIFQTAANPAGRAADALSLNLKDIPGTTGFSWRVYVWPEFSCTDLRTSTAPNAKVLRFVDNVGERTYVQLTGATSTCNVTLWNGSWATPTNTITTIDWARDQMLILQLSSGTTGTTFRVMGSNSGDKSMTPTALQITWNNMTSLQIGPTAFSGRVTPPITTSGDTATAGVYGPPALLDLQVTTTTTGATFAFNSSAHVSSFVDWGVSTPSTVVTGPQGTRHVVNVTGLTTNTTYVYRVRMNSVRSGDTFTGATMTFRTK